MQLIPKEFAKRLNKANWEDYSGHTWRRISATTAAENGMSAVSMMKQGRWVDDKMPNHYIENSDRAKIEASKAVEVKTKQKIPLLTLPCTALTAVVSQDEKKVRSIAQILANDHFHPLWSVATPDDIQLAAQLIKKAELDSNNYMLHHMDESTIDAFNCEN